jgi:uncharacterized cupredoxin-like copper-binding protein
MEVTMSARTWAISLLASMSLVAVGCKGDDDDDDTTTSGATQAGTQVEVTLTEYSVSVDPDHVPAGATTFNVTNSGSVMHEFVVIKTDIDEADLPIKDNKVDEDAEGIEPVDEIDGIDPGKTKHLRLELDAGKHVLICNRQRDLPDGGKESHYDLGMHVAFTVE